MSPKTAISFPDMEEILYTSNSVAECATRYVDILKSTRKIENELYANKLSEYLRLISDKKFDDELVKDCKSISDLVYKWKSDTNLDYPITISRRKKDFISMNQKIQLFLTEGKPLSTINDIFGMRIVIGNPDSKDDLKVVQACYDILYQIINFLIVIKGSYPIDVEFSKQDFNKENFPNVFIPEVNSIPEPGFFQNNIKDYILNPKSNGYQSLHMLFMKSSGLVLELQIRTAAMDTRAEFGKAKHGDYKSDKYSNHFIKFDKDKVAVKDLFKAPFKTNI